MPGDHAMATDNDIVADLTKIVDLASFADDSIAHAAAVDGRAGSDFNVVMNDDLANLRNFDVALRAQHVAESVLPDDTAGMDYRSIADMRWVIEEPAPIVQL